MYLTSHHFAHEHESGIQLWESPGPAGSMKQCYLCYSTAFNGFSTSLFSSVFLYLLLRPLVTQPILHTFQNTSQPSTQLTQLFLLCDQLPNPLLLLAIRHYVPFARHLLSFLRPQIYQFFTIQLISHLLYEASPDYTRPQFSPNI